MSLMVLACECGAAEPLARQVLEPVVPTTWLSVPIHKGKEHCLTVLSHFPEPFQQLVAYQALLNHIEENSSFVVFVGYDHEYFYWEDVASNAPAEVASATAIIKRFA